jgi:hypothetical protein
MLRCKQCFKKRKIYVWKCTAHEWFQNCDTWILHPFLWLNCAYWIPMSNSEYPMQLLEVLHRQLYLFQQGFHPFQSMPMHFVGWTPPPHAKIPMMPNNISGAKHTNKDYLTCSICCAWVWTSSHFNSILFFIQSSAFFSFFFCLACGFLKIRAFIEPWSCCLGSLGRKKGQPYFPTSKCSSCLLSKWWRNNHLVT